ncbi:MAG: glycosyltransferase family 9 protein [Chthoniobacterales bacterium]|nr:glycosyltransferase family 9 protein [Chthoniobacterales bacterium]
MDSKDGCPADAAASPSLLLIKPGSMGDVLHALPVASAIHRAWPEGRLTWVVDPRWAPLLQGNPAVSRILPFPRQDFRGPLGWGRAARWYATLAGLCPDFVVDLQGLLRSGLMAKCSRGKKVIGLSDAREGGGLFYHEAARTPGGEHAVLRYLRCLPLLGIPVPDCPDFYLPVGDAPTLGRDFVVLHPFARGAGKSLDAEAIRAFVGEFQAGSKYPVVVVGAGKVPRLPGSVVDLSGRTTLPELIGILRAARFVVSVDSGPMHLAAALGVPLLGIHTWSDPRLVGPFGDTAWIWQGGGIRLQDIGQPPLDEKPFTQADARECARFVAEKLR